MIVTAEARAQAQELLDFIDASPSPWHVAATVAQRLESQGFEQLREDQRWSLKPGGRYFVVRGGASVVGFVPGTQDLAQSAFRIIGAHVDVEWKDNK